MNVTDFGGIVFDYAAVIGLAFLSFLIIVAYVVVSRLRK